ncbi:MAG TPA: NlpC/P60 family protein [Mycobacteriales bacterium]|nr:NlpC/P60 family protein [Mycobacteriales bacterium]
MRSRFPRALVVLGLCAGLASNALAAKGGAPVDPAAAVVAAVRSQVGDGYAWGGTGPDAWDCSGLVFAAWRGPGRVTTVPRVSRDQHAWAVPLPVEQVVPGDLVFFGQPVTHVGLVTARRGTVVTMVDSASSRHAVVERTAWSTGVVRYGRVPRPGMPAVQPWTPKTGTPKTGTPRTGTPKPAPAVTATAPLTLPARTQLAPSTAVALAAAAAARRALGSPDTGDAVFVQRVWRQAGGVAVPGTKDALAAAGRPVALADARVGDLVVYGPPAAHVGLYVGNGLMIDASRSLGKVVLRPVWAGPSLRLVRLPSG